MLENADIIVILASECHTDAFMESLLAITSCASDEYVIMRLGDVALENTSIFNIAFRWMRPVFSMCRCLALTKLWSHVALDVCVYLICNLAVLQKLSLH